MEYFAKVVEFSHSLTFQNIIKLKFHKFVIHKVVKMIFIRYFCP